LSQAASVATLPSALFGERLSLGASWVYSIQQVLLPENRPRFPLSKGNWSRTCRSHLISAVELGCLDTISLPTFLLLFLSSCLSQFFTEKFPARIAQQRRSPTPSTP